MDWAAVAHAIGAATQQPFRIAGHETCGGGCINQSYRIRGQDGRRYFVKLNAAHCLPMFACEAAGLRAIAATRTVRVPLPITHGECSTRSFLVLEYFDLSHRGDASRLGEQLAALHRNTADRFGWRRDNFIGTTPQPNRRTDDWVMAWREQRLEYQLRLALLHGYGTDLQALGDRLLEALADFFSGYTPQSSLLHGDLWSGNHAFLPDGASIIFDPAPYYGDRECDLAMTELFGGFGADFHAAYRAAFPLDAGYAARKELYNLYHILNHANLFGGGYVRQAQEMMRHLLAELG